MQKHPIRLVFLILQICCAILFAQKTGLIAAQVVAAQNDSIQPLPPLPPLSLGPIEKAERDGTVLRLSLKDVTRLALSKNLDIAIQDTNEGLSRQAIIQAQGPYDPTIALSLGVQSQKSPNTNYTTKSASGNYSTMDYANWDLSFQQNVRTVSNFSASYNTNRTDSDIGFLLFSPQFNTSAAFTFTQPLRRNLRTDQNRSQIKLANLDLKMSDSQFKAKVVDIISNVQGQYWDLVGAMHNCVKSNGNP